MKWAFQQIAEGALSTEHVWMKACERGLKCSRTSFWHLITNPAYIGKVSIPEFKDEEAYLADGQHTPLISESLFYRVQQILELRKRKVEEDLDIDGLATLAVENLKNLSEFYINTDSDIKRAIVGSVYPEKWVFDGELHRTPEVNEAAQLIFQINKKLGHKKTGAKSLKDFTPVRCTCRDSNPKPSHP
nr:recombinase family protein [Pedobacter cryoconitis]